MMDYIWVARRFWFAHIAIETDSTFVFTALCRKQVQVSRLNRMLREILVIAYESPHCGSCFVIARLMG
ncbi:hypothetical protein RHMOL_Rhmol13G0230800 [Rhododendron molle]|uniref:Uncharacterized protein n=1 Tax=Rhododendron molle TaxID=49168 RepID=A0ACC0LAR5_RHOML|nr:hypothetical protein RHMOL_Rhmol13G0230800 [Rhododendron molle]